MFEDVYSHRQTTTSIGAAGRHFLVVFKELQTTFAKKLISQTQRLHVSDIYQSQKRVFSIFLNRIGAVV